VNEPRASRYHRLQRRTTYVTVALGVIGLIALLGGASVRLRDIVDGSVVRYVLVVTSSYELVALPASWYRSCVLERQYGLSHVSAGVWFLDAMKAGVLTLIGALAAGTLIQRAIEFWPQMWWVAAGAGASAFTAILAWIAPVALFPLFSRSAPIGTVSPLGRRIADLCERAAVSALDVRECHLGDRTARTHAALVGIGRTRRILLSHTVLTDYTHDEIEAILAHEIAHHVHHDVTKAWIAGSIVWMVGFLSAAIALDSVWQHLGLSAVTDIAGLPVIVATVWATWFAVTPLLNWLSRRSERRADRFALGHASRPAAFLDAMRRMAAHNMVEEHPSRAVFWLFHSHPTVTDRLEAARQWIDEAPLTAARRPAAAPAAAATLVSTRAPERYSSAGEAGVG
jgi:STE24 endopeptidase